MTETSERWTTREQRVVVGLAHTGIEDKLCSVFLVPITQVKKKVCGPAQGPAAVSQTVGSVAATLAACSPVRVNAAPPLHRCCTASSVNGEINP